MVNNERYPDLSGIHHHHETLRFPAFLAGLPTAYGNTVCAAALDVVIAGFVEVKASAGIACFFCAARNVLLFGFAQASAQEIQIFHFVLIFGYKRPALLPVVSVTGDCLPDLWICAGLSGYIVVMIDCANKAAALYIIIAGYPGKDTVRLLVACGSAISSGDRSLLMFGQYPAGDFELLHG